MFIKMTFGSMQYGEAMNNNEKNVSTFVTSSLSELLLQKYHSSKQTVKLFFLSHKANIHIVIFYRPNPSAVVTSNVSCTSGHPDRSWNLKFVVSIPNAAASLKSLVLVSSVILGCLARIQANS